MSSGNLAGVIPVAAAPFTGTGAMDFNGVQALVDFQIRAGAKGLALFGFATEFYKLSEAEKLQMLKVARDVAGNRLPLVVSVTEQCTELAVRVAREYEAGGADTLMVLPPFVIPAGKDGFVRHVQAVAKAVHIPVMVQYSPAETGVAIDAETLADMMTGAENLRYLKVESKPPGPMITAIKNKSRTQPGIFVGYAGLQMLDAMRRGAAGVMPGSSLTDIYCRIEALFREGKEDAAIVLHNKLTPFLNVIFQSIEMIVWWEKVILKRRGIIGSDYCRFPNYQPDQAAWELFEIYYSELSKEFTV